MARFLFSVIFLSAIIFGCSNENHPTATSNTTSLSPIASNNQYSSNGLQCGHWCFFYGCRMLGVNVSLEQTAGILPIRPQGHSFQELQDAFAKQGVIATGFQQSISELKKSSFPCILHLSNPDHFVIASGIAMTLL